MIKQTPYSDRSNTDATVTIITKSSFAIVQWLLVIALIAKFAKAGGA
jgi:hypothetical protein